MNIQRGMFRLWIALSVVWGISISVVHYYDVISAPLYARYHLELKPEILHAPVIEGKNPFDIFDTFNPDIYIPPVKDGKNKYDIIDDIEANQLKKLAADKNENGAPKYYVLHAKNGSIVFANGDIPIQWAMTIKEDFTKKEAFLKDYKISSLLKNVLLLPLAMLILGIGIGWVAKGFKS